MRNSKEYSQLFQRPTRFGIIHTYINAQSGTYGDVRWYKLQMCFKAFALRIVNLCAGPILVFKVECKENAYVTK